MYPDTKTWNPFIGCLHDCIYCGPSFKRVVRWTGRMIGCPDCMSYKPHYHPERLATSKIPSFPIVFVFGQGDMTFCRPEFVRETFKLIKMHRPRMNKLYYFQSKNPACFKQYLGEFPENTILLTTIETNRDEGYEEISKAPKPSVRFYEFLDLDYPRKVVTIEPVLDFDLEVMLTWMNLLRRQKSLEYIWFGYDSKACGLPEPPKEKAQRLVDMLQDLGIEVRGKSLRGVKLRGARP